MAALAVLLCGFTPAPADVIHFKDGMRTVCQDRAWIQDAEVHCEYAGGLLVYPAADVLSIEKSPATRRQSAAVEDEPDAPPPPAGDASAAALKPAPKQPDGGLPQPPAAGRSGILFYDPRRPKKFWSSPSGHHDTLNEAVAALAAEFGRTPQWVERQLNDTNDLGELRAHLQSRLGGDAATAALAEPEADGLKFYDPRRNPKYQTGPDARHATYAEALGALAREFQSSEEWVERHMGDSNQVDAIRRNLMDAGKAAR